MQFTADVQTAASHWRQPHRIFAAIALLFGAMWIALFPPFQNPDEYVHVYRAYDISEGTWCARPAPTGHDAGGWLPSGLPQTGQAFYSALEFRSDLRVDRTRWARAAAIPLDPTQRVFVSYWQTALYPPTGYLPCAVAMAVGRDLGLAPVWLVYLGRAANLLLWVILGAAAIRAAGRYGWLLFQVALLPMSLSLGAAVNVDALALAMALLFAGLVFGILDARPEQVSRGRIGAIAAAFVVLALCKAYLPLWGLVLIAPACRHPRSRLVALLAALGVSVLGMAAWSYASRAVHGPFLSDYDAGRQWASMCTQPLRTLVVLVMSILRDGLSLTQMIGILGWLNLWLPMPVYAAYLLLLAGVGVFAAQPAPLTLRARGLLLGICAVLHVSIYVRAYLLASTLGSGMVSGVQGRYFLPYLPALLLLVSGTQAFPRLRAAWQQRQAVWLPRANVLLLACVTLRIAWRFYGP